VTCNLLRMSRARLKRLCSWLVSALACQKQNFLLPPAYVGPLWCLTIHTVRRELPMLLQMKRTGWRIIVCCWSFFSMSSLAEPCPMTACAPLVTSDQQCASSPLTHQSFGLCHVEEWRVLRNLGGTSCARHQQHLICMLGRCPHLPTSPRARSRPPSACVRRPNDKSIQLFGSTAAGAVSQRSNSADVGGGSGGGEGRQGARR